MLSISFTNQYLKDLELIKKRNLPKTELDVVVQMLANEQVLPVKYKDHLLKGKFAGFRECHIRPDWLLIYVKNKTKLTLLLTRTGTHSDLLK